jgi:hypothetical protein
MGNPPIFLNLQENRINPQSTNTAADLSHMDGFGIFSFVQVGAAHRSGWHSESFAARKQRKSANRNSEKDIHQNLVVI